MDDFKVVFQELKEEDLKTYIKLAQDELNRRQQCKKDEAWKRVSDAIEDFLKLPNTQLTVISGSDSLGICTLNDIYLIGNEGVIIEGKYK